MGVAISGLIAALAVIYALSVTATTSTQPVVSLLQLVLNIFNGSGRVISADEAMTGLFYSVSIYLIVFSVSRLVLHYVGLILLGLGVPDEHVLRDARQAERMSKIDAANGRRQAKLTARYLARAVQVNRVRPPARIPPAEADAGSPGGVEGVG